MFTPLPDEDDSGVVVEDDLRALRPPSSGSVDDSPCWTRRLGLPRETCALVNAAAVAVATILGTGILALPVRLAHAGMAPFGLMFALCLGMQIATVVLMVELPSAEPCSGIFSKYCESYSTLWIKRAVALFTSLNY